MKKYINKKIVFILGLIIIIGAIIFVGMPSLLLDKTEIKAIYPLAVIEKTPRIEEDFTLEIENPRQIVGVYVDDVFVDNAKYEYGDENHLLLDLPDELFSTAGTRNIKLQYRVNGEIFKYSNSIPVEVLSKEEIPVPEIENISVEALSLNNGILQQIEINGKNIAENTQLFLNDEVIDATYQDGKLIANLRASQWLGEKEVEFKIKQCYEEYNSYIEGNIITIYEDNPDENQAELQNQEVDDTDIDDSYFVEFIKTLDDFQGIIVLTVCGDASKGMTEQAAFELSQLGLKYNLSEQRPGKSYIAIISNGEVVYEEMSNDMLEYNGVVDDCVVYASSANYFAGNYAVTNINDARYCPNKNGLNIVCYDNKENKHIDSICFDINYNYAISNELE